MTAEPSESIAANPVRERRRLLLAGLCCAAAVVLLEFPKEWEVDAAHWLGFGPAWLSRFLCFVFSTMLAYFVGWLLTAVAWSWVRVHVLNERRAPADESTLFDAILATVLAVCALLAVLRWAM
jgi:hypothetical protein